MKRSCVLTITFLLIFSGGVFADEYVDGVLSSDVTSIQSSAIIEGDDVAAIDIVGDTSSSATGTGLANGNSYEVTNGTTLLEAEFYLNFTGTQTLNFYVYDSPVEMGTYTRIYSSSRNVSGTGAGWYSSGGLNVPLNSGTYYIIAVSWSGNMTYYYGVGDSQSTSFGAYVHGYATGAHPLPLTFASNINDQAVYHQRLTTGTSSCDYCLTDTFGFDWCLNVIATDGQAYYMDGTTDANAGYEAIATYVYSNQVLSMSAINPGGGYGAFTYNTKFISSTRASGVWVDEFGSYGSVTGVDLVECGSAAAVEAEVTGPTPGSK